MKSSTKNDIAAWEGERGAIPGPNPVTGTPNQIEWAERIKRHVSKEFDRVAASFRSIAARQSDGKRADTEAIIAILEDKRAEVMSREQPGYFIRGWQEINDQVRKMIGQDSRYQAIKARIAARISQIAS